MKNLYVYALLMLSSVALAGEGESCFALSARNDAYAPLSKKLALVNPNMPTVEMLTNAAKPSKSEKKLIGLWLLELEECMKNNPDYSMSDQPPHIANLFNSQNLDFFATTSDLYAGKLTYGDYARARARSSSEFLSKLQEILQSEQAKNDAAAAQKAAEAERKEMLARQEYERYVQQQQAQENAKRQAALQYLANQPKPYQLPQPYQMPVPQRTNCTTFGNVTNCTTR